MAKTCKRCRTEVIIKNCENAEGYADRFRLEAYCECLSVTGWGYNGAIKAFDAEHRKRDKDHAKK